jgi:signal transduction histidine kinase
VKQSILIFKGLKYKETLMEIFEPFFSTKPATGMGLGLGIAKRTIDLYGGQIKVESKKGSGTLFKIILPG